MPVLIAVDATPPTATSLIVPARATPDFAVSWSGQDSESGLAYYNTQYRIDGGKWTDWLTRTLLTQETYDGQSGHVYAFQVRAVDLAGNSCNWVTSGLLKTTGPKKYYAVAGRRVAMRVGDMVYYLHGDHLGSTSLVTTGTGAEVARQLYLPYGAPRWISGTLPTDFTFTGQRADATGLMYYRARYYSSYLNRWIQPDTIVPQPGNPQDLNRFSYARNNPLKYRDPSGHWVDTVLDAMFIGWDAVSIVVDIHDAVANGGVSSEIGRNLGTDALALVVDVGCAMLPGATGGGPAARLAFAGGDVARATVQLSKAERIAQRLLQGGLKFVQAANKGTPSLPKVYGPNEGPEVALGHLGASKKYPGIEEFANKNQWKHWGDWWKSGLLPPDCGDFGDQFKNAMNRTSGIHFALDGINDFAAALLDGAKGWHVGQWTDVELYEILHNKNWYDKTSFYREGELLKDMDKPPFLGTP